MFWTAADIFKKRIDEGRTDEAAKIYEALKRVLPYIKDSDPRPDGQPQAAVSKPAAKAQPDDGIPGLGIDKEPHRTTDSAAAFMQSAARRLTVARQLDKQQADLKSKQEDSSNSTREEFSAISALSVSKKEPSASEEAYSRNSSNSPLKKEEENQASAPKDNSSNSSNSPSKEEDNQASAPKENSCNSSNLPLKEEDNQASAPKENSSNSPLKEKQEAGSSIEEENSSNSSNSPLKEAQDDNLSLGEKFSAVSALSASKKEPSASEEAIPSSEKDNSRNSQNSPLQEDLSGHLSVSLDEGIIRPIEGLTAIQRVVLACVVGHPGYSVTKISESTGIPQTLIERHVAVLVDHGLIEPRKGELNTAEYYPI
jgi:DNA-binding transcriptional ArsR family regulator